MLFKEWDNSRPDQTQASRRQPRKIWDISRIRLGSLPANGRGL